MPDAKKKGKEKEREKEKDNKEKEKQEEIAAEMEHAVAHLSKPKVRQELTNPQKAAAIVVSLGVDKASLLYQFMDPEEVEQVTLEVAKLGMLDADSTENVLSEFYQMCMTNKAVTEGGLEYARTVLEKAFGSQTASALLDKVTKSLKTGSLPL